MLIAYIPQLLLLILQVGVDVESGEGDIALRATGSQVAFPGFLAVWGGGGGGDVAADGAEGLGDADDGGGEGNLIGSTAAAAAVISGLQASLKTPESKVNQERNISAATSGLEADCSADALCLCCAAVGYQVLCTEENCLRMSRRSCTHATAHSGASRHLVQNAALSILWRRCCVARMAATFSAIFDQYRVTLCNRSFKRVPPLRKGEVLAAVDVAVLHAMSPPPQLCSASETPN